MTPKPPKRTRRSRVTITGGIVRPESIRPHENHPLKHLTPAERLEGACLALGNLILNLIKKGVVPADDEVGRLN